MVVLALHVQFNVLQNVRIRRNNQVVVVPVLLVLHNVHLNVRDRLNKHVQIAPMAAMQVVATIVIIHALDYVVENVERPVVDNVKENVGMVVMLSALDTESRHTVFHVVIHVVAHVMRTVHTIVTLHVKAMAINKIVSYG